MTHTEPSTNDEHPLQAEQAEDGGFRMPPLEGYEGSPEEVERRWYEEAYLPRGAKMRQLTFRSMFLGCLIGGIMAIPNIYMGLKSGVIMGLSLTSTLVAYMIWNALLTMRVVRGRLTVLEYNAMASAASSASYTTVGGLVSSVAAFILINHRPVPLHWLLLWTFCVAVLGVTMAIPMKRRIINLEQLPFPGAIAGAETLELLCVEGGKNLRTGYALLFSAIAGALYGFWNGCTDLVAITTQHGMNWLAKIWEALAKYSPNEITAWVSTKLLGSTWVNRGVTFNFDMLFLVSGCFMGLRTTAVMFGAAVFCWMMYVPALEWNGLVHTTSGMAPTYGDYIQYTLWFGASCLVVSGLLQVVFMGWDGWKKIRQNKHSHETASVQSKDLADLEAPRSWFLAGQIFAGGALVFIGSKAFGIPWWQTVIAILLSLVLSIVTCRIYGQTGLSVNSSMAKVTQLTFGSINSVRPSMSVLEKAGQLNINLMTAAITTGSACNAADLLGDLKTGYFLGAHPRKQFLAQFIGIFAGTIASVITFYALVPNETIIEGKREPAVMVDDKPIYLTTHDVARVQTDDKGARTLALDAESVKTIGAHAGMEEGKTVTVVLAQKILPKFLAPSALSWKGVAMVVASGIGNMEKGKKIGLFSGAVIGLILTVLARALPSSIARHVPSPGVVGLGFIFQWYMCLMMFLGALGSELWKRGNKENHGEFMVPVASGFFVGAPLVGAAILFIANGAEIYKNLSESIQAMFH